MVFPPVFDSAGNLVLPGSYEAITPEGTVVAVRGAMKMYTILNDQPSRPYMITCQRLQVIAGEMASWDDNPKKRAHDSDEPDPSKRPPSGSGPSKPLPPDPGPSKSQDPGPSKSQARDEDEMM